MPLRKHTWWCTNDLTAPPWADLDVRPEREGLHELVAQDVGPLEAQLARLATGNTVILTASGSNDSKINV